MNIFSNIGITELILILLLALLVVGPERLPELGRRLAKTLRDVRKAYENLTRDLGPELMSIQETTRELRESVDSVRSIPKDMVDSVVKAAELEEMAAELKDVSDSVGQVGQTLSQAQKAVRNPLRAAKTMLSADSGKQADKESEPAGVAESTPEVAGETTLVEREPEPPVTDETALVPPDETATVEKEPEMPGETALVEEEREEPIP